MAKNYAVTYIAESLEAVFTPFTGEIKMMYLDAYCGKNTEL